MQSAACPSGPACRGHPADRLGPARSRAPTATGAAAYLAEAERWQPEDAFLPDVHGDVTPADGPADMSVQPAVLPPGQRRARVLVADDNADMRLYLRRLTG